MYIVVCFLLLWVLFQVILIDARCYVENSDPNRLYIMETPNKIKSRSELFTKILQSRFSIYPSEQGIANNSSPLHDIIDYELLDNCSSYFNYTIKDAQHLRYMVHLQVEDFYQNNYNDILMHGFEWADDVTDCMPINNCTKKLVKLVSSPVTSIPSLYDMIIKFPKETRPVLYRILVCSKLLIDLNSYTTYSYFDTVTIKIKFQSSQYCDDPTALKAPLHKNVIAILAPNPSFVAETIKPVIFYEKPYFLPKATDIFDNGIMRTGSMKILARALLQLLKRKNWSRFAVLSDDSEQSYNFEQELRFLFQDEGLSFVMIAVSRTNHNYHFSEVLATLKQHDIRIIIATVDEQLADTLGQQAKEHQLTSSHKVLWIAPCWSTSATKMAAENMGIVLNLIPSEVYNEEQNTLNYINRTVELIEHNQDKEYYDYSDSKTFARDLKNYLNWINENIDVYQTNIDNSMKIATFSRGQLKLIKASYAPTDRQDGCFLKSKNYYKPCDDMDIIYFMLVVMVFAVSILGITFFFDTNDTPYNRM